MNFTNNSTHISYKINYLIVFSPCLYIIICLFLCFICRFLEQIFVNKSKPVSKLNKDYNLRLILDNIDHMELDLEQECSICLEKLSFCQNSNNIEILKTTCNHLYHYNCILNENIKNCPLCRNNLEFNGYCTFQKNTV